METEGRRHRDSANYFKIKTPSPGELVELCARCARGRAPAGGEVCPRGPSRRGLGRVAVAPRAPRGDLASERSAHAPVVCRAPHAESVRRPDPRAITRVSRVRRRPRSPEVKRPGVSPSTVVLPAHTSSAAACTALELSLGL